MCLANVYRDRAEKENLLLTNVQKIECKDGMVILTDLMERQKIVEGSLEYVDLVGNTAVIRLAEV